MAGKFINTTHLDTVNTLIENKKKLMNNPFYIWMDKPPTPVDYFNLNKEASTVDEGFKSVMSEFGKDNPLHHDRIIDFYLYGLEQLQIQMEHGEFGAEASDITGEAVILPNTIIPYPGDYFKIKYLKENYLFKVTGASHDTLENGANLYKIQYKLDSAVDHEKYLNIKDTYNFISNNIGTGFNPILRVETVDLIQKFEAFLERLKTYYVDTFYNDRVQTFIYLFKGMRFYDPYMVQFLKNNDILRGSSEYIYVSHQTDLKSYFNIEYDKTFFGCLERNDFKNIRSYHINAISRHIGGIDTSIFSTRPEDYLEVDFRHCGVMDSIYGILPCFSEDFIDNIESGELFDGCDSIYNIVIKYIHKMDLDETDMNIMNIDMHNNIKLFYIIPSIIFCLEYMIKDMMKRYQ